MTKKFDNAKYKIAQKQYQDFLSLMSKESYDISPEMLRDLFERLKRSRITGYDPHARYIMQAPEIQALQKTFGGKTLARLHMALDKNDMRPSDMPIIMFAAHPDLEFIDGTFSTYDVNLSVQKQKHTRPSTIRKKINNSVRNATHVNTDYKELWTAAIENCKESVDAAIAKHLNGNIEFLLEDMTLYVMDRMGILGEIILSIHVVDDWDAVPSEYRPREQNVVGFMLPGPFSADIYINRNKIFKEYIPKNLANNDRVRFAGLMAVFTHEFSHVIDYHFGDRSALGIQKSNIAKKLYSWKKNVYATNPTERIADNMEEIMFKEILETHYK